MLGKRLRAATGVTAAIIAAALIAACGSSSEVSGQKYMKMPGGGEMLVSSMSGTTTMTARTGSMGGSGTSGVHVDTSVPEVNGQKPIASQVLATSYWQGMKIQAQTMTPIRFLVFNGNKERMLYPPKGASFHLMIMLDDRYTNEPIAYSTVQATIRRSDGKSVYGQPLWQWPMISAFMGPHYGNDVKLPGSGRYSLSLLISPPAVARNAEYKGVWLRPHTVTMAFDWNAKTATAKVIGGAKQGSSEMSDMTGMSANTSVQSVNDVSRPATYVLSTAKWQGMDIEAAASKPTTFYLPGSSAAATPAAAVKDPSMNLMVMLKDKYTSEPVPYSTVTATVSNSAGKVVLSHQVLRPTISAFNGPYYGSDVKLPGPGRYTVKLLITPPRSARHLEYQHVWLHDHTATMSFSWDPQKDLK